MDAELKVFLENMQAQMTRMEERMTRLEFKVDHNAEMLKDLSVKGDNVQAQLNTVESRVIDVNESIRLAIRQNGSE